MRGWKVYAVRRLLNAVEYTVNGERLHLSLGICGKTGRTAFISFDVGWMMLHPLMVRDVYVIDGRCEDAERCLCLECEHNRTTYTSFKNKTGIGKLFKRKRGFIRFLKRIRRVENSLAEEIKRIDFGKPKAYGFKDAPWKSVVEKRVSEK